MTPIPSINPNPGTRASVYQTVYAGATSRQTQMAVRLATDAGVVANFGGNGAKAQTYNAVGMLNLLSQAAGRYRPAAAPKPATPTPATTGTAANAGSDTASNWARLLQARPSMAFTASAYLLNQGIVATL